MSINKKISDFLRENGISQSEFAKKTGISQQNLNRLLNSDDIKVSQLIEITKALALPVTYFFDGKEHVNNTEIEGYKNRIKEQEDAILMFKRVFHEKALAHVQVLLLDAFRGENKEIKKEVLSLYKEHLRKDNLPLHAYSFDLDDYAKDEIYDAISSAIEILKNKKP